MISIVLDTNVLISAIGKISPYHSIWNAIKLGHLGLCISDEILYEYHEILEQKTTALIAKRICEALVLLPNVTMTTIYYHWQLISKDVDDNKFADCAIASNALFLVTEDKHFNILEQIDFPKVNLIKPEDFIRKFL